MNSAAPTRYSASGSRALPREPVLVKCECGYKGTHLMEHYGMLRCKCGKMWWALQPRRDGPLRAFPWPGNQPPAEQPEDRER